MSMRRVHGSHGFNRSARSLCAYVRGPLEPCNGSTFLRQQTVQEDESGRTAAENVNLCKYSCVFLVAIGINLHACVKTTIPMMLPNERILIEMAVVYHNKLS